MSGIAPMRPVDPSAVTERRQTAWYNQSWVLIVGMFVLDGLVWWLTGADIMFGFIVAVATWGTLRQTRYNSARRVLYAVAVMALVLVAGAVTAALFAIGLPAQVRLAQGAGGIALGLIVWWIARWRATRQTGSGGALSRA